MMKSVKQVVVKGKTIVSPQETVCENNKGKYKIRRRRNHKTPIDNTAREPVTQTTEVITKPEKSSKISTKSALDIKKHQSKDDEENKLTMVTAKHSIKIQKRQASNKSSKGKNNVLNDIKNCTENIKPHTIESVSNNTTQEKVVQAMSAKNEKKTYMRKYAAIPAHENSVCKTSVKDTTVEKSTQFTDNNKEDFTFTMPLSPTGRRRHNGLKAQICQFKNQTSRAKSNINRIPSQQLSNDRDLPAPDSSQKVEVPKTPCVVTVSKVKHHPLLPMKKRWRKYMLLSNANDDKTESNCSPNAKDNSKTNVVKSDVTSKNHQPRDKNCISGSSGVIMHTLNQHTNTKSSSNLFDTAISTNKEFTKHPLHSPHTVTDNKRVSTHCHFKRKLSYSGSDTAPASKKNRLPKPPKLIPIQPMKNERTPSYKADYYNSNSYVDINISQNAHLSSFHPQAFASPDSFHSNANFAECSENNILSPQSIYIRPRKSHSGVQNIIPSYNHVNMPSLGLQSVNSLYNLRSLTHLMQYPDPANMIFSPSAGAIYDHRLATNSSYNGSESYNSPESLIAAKQAYMRHCAEISPHHQRIPNNLYYCPSPLRTPSF